MNRIKYTGNCDEILEQESKIQSKKNVFFENIKNTQINRDPKRWSID